MAILPLYKLLYTNYLFLCLTSKYRRIKDLISMRDIALSELGLLFCSFFNLLIFCKFFRKSFLVGQALSD